MDKNLKQHGFTLIEIMVVVVILGILAALVVPNIMERPDHARRAAAKQDIRSLVNALKMYRLDNFDYPSSLSEVAPYLEGRVPKDPWRRDYQYQRGGHRSGGAAKFDVYSYGADGIEGGNGLDADIGNWNLEQ